KSVIATTNHDLVNLEVALLARETNPAQRVVLLLADPNMAQMLREAANVRLAFSAPALAAPAFLAGLYGARGQGVFAVRDRPFAAIDLLIHPGDPLAGQAVRAVAVDYDMLPVVLLPAGRPPPDRPLHMTLQVGDRLVAVTALGNLERLLRRQPSSAGYAVEVTAFPIPTREWLVNQVQGIRQVSAAEASAALDRLPVRVQEHLTRGQAEELLARLSRERGSARVVNTTQEQAGGAPPCGTR